MLTLLSIIAIGFFLGMRHATDPDHVIAVTTIVSRQRNLGRAALIGVFWGLGHTLTIFAVGSAIILFNLVIPARVGLSMELSVAVMLILLGVWNVVSFLRAVPAEAVQVHSHAHSHDGHVHSHEHVHISETHSHEHAQLTALDQRFGQAAPYQLLRPLLVGIVHGLAGSAAVALLILATIQNSRWAIAYLLVFGIGTIAGMMLITAALALPFSFAGHRFVWLNRSLVLGSGLLSLCFGVFVCYDVGFVSGLFISHPHWTPT